MRKKSLLASAFVAVTALVITAAAGSTAYGKAPKPVTITYGIWAGTQTPAMKQIAAAFEKENPNIKVKVQDSPWPQFWSTLQTGAAGGTAPDVFWMLAQQIKPYAAGGQLLDISRAVKKLHVYPGSYPKAVLKLYDQGDGKLYGLPKDVDTNAVWFNKALFDKAGVKYPSANWTWADFRATAKKLTDPTAGTWGVAADLDYQSGYYNSIFQAGGNVISSDGKKALLETPQAQAGIKFWTDLQADGSSPTLQQLSDTAGETMFEQGKLAMYVSGAYWALQLYNNKAISANVDVAPLPIGVKRATVSSGIENVAYAKTKHPIEAQKFLLFASGKEAALIQAKTGAVLPAFAGTQKLWMSAMPKFTHLKVFIDAFKYAVPLPVQGNAAAWQGMQGQYLTDAWNGKQSVADATKAYDAAIDKVLATG
jgi:multiple sugar transport system substrate-binding protein